MVGVVALHLQLRYTYSSFCLFSGRFGEEFRKSRALSYGYIDHEKMSELNCVTPSGHQQLAALTELSQTLTTRTPIFHGLMQQNKLLIPM